MFSEKSRVWHPGVGLTPAGLPRERTGHCHKAREAAVLAITVPTGRSGWGVGCLLSLNTPVSLGGGCLSQLHLLCYRRKDGTERWRDLPQGAQQRWAEPDSVHCRGCGAAPRGGGRV